jgi:hypothetical protein
MLGLREVKIAIITSTQQIEAESSSETLVTTYENTECQNTKLHVQSVNINGAVAEMRTGHFSNINYP